MKTTTKPVLMLVLTLGLASSAFAQAPAASFERGSSLQVWQTPEYQTMLSQCAKPPQPFSIGGGAAANASTEEPPAPALPLADAIPGIIESGKQWRVVWAWQGNNADGPIAGPDGSLLFAKFSGRKVTLSRMAGFSWYPSGVGLNQTFLK